ncbi:hypothetical protein SKAU_G00317070 [Synaphobranchus kaupii]|uniref:Uncharacterized protein n=1 Tax=Synaphobranchus kaupii TaxID=118154 RepID=A0A9Q1ESS6_SYNKA|nr:hypothetical protein SKAU_G00317070 [Synaphobranchus kaupii]
MHSGKYELEEPGSSVADIPWLAHFALWEHKSYYGTWPARWEGVAAAHRSERRDDELARTQPRIGYAGPDLIPDESCSGSRQRGLGLIKPRLILRGPGGHGCLTGRLGQRGLITCADDYITHRAPLAATGPSSHCCDSPLLAPPAAWLCCHAAAVTGPAGSSAVD